MKAYIKPTTKEIRVRQHLLTGPSQVTGVSGLTDVTVSTDDYNGGTADSRRSSVWDEEDEE